MGKAVRWLGRETREILPAFVYFSVVFSIVIVTDALYVRGYPVRGVHFAEALILALIVSKAMLVADALPFVDAFPRRPLAYNTVFKTIIYTVAAVLIYLAERTVRLAIEYAGRPGFDERLEHGVPWSRFWMVIIWLLAAFLVFVSYRELDRRLGGTLRRMFFGGVDEQA